MKTEINKELARKVIETVSCGLSCGLGKPIPGQMCVEAAVNYAMGRPHGDEPECVGVAVRSYKIRLNDAKWSSNKARAEGMIKIAIAQLGSDTIDQKRFLELIAIKTVQKIISDLFRKRNQEAIAVLCEQSVDLKTAETAARSAKKNAATTAYAAYADAAYAAYAAADAAAYAYAAYADADAYAAADAAANADPDYFLRRGAEICLEVLIEMKSPGTEFLYLLDEKTK